MYVSAVATTACLHLSGFERGSSPHDCFILRFILRLLGTFSFSVISVSSAVVSSVVTVAMMAATEASKKHQRKQAFQTSSQTSQRTTTATKRTGEE